MAGPITKHVGAKVPVELLEAAIKATGLPSPKDTAVIRYALAALAGLDPAEHAKDLRTGRPRKAAAA
jgi:hypothetical protein